MTKTVFFAAAMLAGVTRLYAQSADSTEDDSKNHLKAGLQYLSNQSYLGRTDSLKLPVIIPTLNFETHSGFYLKASGYVNLSSNNQGFDGFSIEPGYEFSKNNWDGSLSLIKNFISDSSNLIVAPVKASLEFYLENDNKIIVPSIGGEYVFSHEGNDFIFYAGLSKSVVLYKDGNEPFATIEPSVSAGGGTQNFYYSFLKNYAQNGRGRGKGRNPNNPVSLTQTSQRESSRFAMLSLSAELPLTLNKGRFEWKTTPALESPLNLIDKGGAGAQAPKSYVYVTSELVYTFK